MRDRPRAYINHCSIRIQFFQSIKKNIKYKVFFLNGFKYIFTDNITKKGSFGHLPSVASDIRVIFGKLLDVKCYVFYTYFQYSLVYPQPKF